MANDWNEVAQVLLKKLDVYPSPGAVETVRGMLEMIAEVAAECCIWERCTRGDMLEIASRVSGRLKAEQASGGKNV